MELPGYNLGHGDINEHLINTSGKRFSFLRDSFVFFCFFFFTVLHYVSLDNELEAYLKPDVESDATLASSWTQKEVRKRSIGGVNSEAQKKVNHFQFLEARKVFKHRPLNSDMNCVSDCLHFPTLHREFITVS